MLKLSESRKLYAPGEATNAIFRTHPEGLCNLKNLHRLGTAKVHHELVRHDRAKTFSDLLSGANISNGDRWRFAQGIVRLYVVMTSRSRIHRCDHRHERCKN
jgi:hypothetical protein